MGGPIPNTSTDSGVLLSIDGFYIIPMKLRNTFGHQEIYCKEDVQERGESVSCRTSSGTKTDRLFLINVNNLTEDGMKVWADDMDLRLGNVWWVCRD